MDYCLLFFVFEMLAKCFSVKKNIDSIKRLSDWRFPRYFSILDSLEKLKDIKSYVIILQNFVGNLVKKNGCWSGKN